MIDFECNASLQIHGWPDLAIGWRYQIPLLLRLGYRVVCPDIMGFGGTDAPQVPPESMSLYSFKRAADDIRELARQLGASKIILGGHDWVSCMCDNLCLGVGYLMVREGRRNRISRRSLAS